MPPPFEAYLGNEPFAFVSYAHQDSKDVYPEITKWHGDGFHLWYDEGIPAAGEWLEEIADAIGRCALFIVLISPRAVASRYVKNEIIYALDKGRPFLAIHMEKTGLDKGLELCMSGHQALCKYEIEPIRYERKLNNVLRGYLSTSETIELIKPSPVKDLPRRMDTRLFLRGMQKTPEENVKEEAVVEEAMKEKAALEEPVIEEPVIEEPAVEDPVVEETEEEVLDSHAEATPSIDDDHAGEGGFREVEITEPDDFGFSSAGDLAGSHPDEIEALPVGHESLDNPPVLGQPFLVREIEYPLSWVNPGQLIVHVPWTGEAVEVPVTEGFWLGERLVSQSEYQGIVGRHTNYFWESQQFPVEQVSWLDCIEFCKALTALERRERRLPLGFEYRLPLEIEWEFACRADTTTKYFFGDEPDLIEEFAWVRRNSKRRTHEVAQKKPNPWGFYDMYGNVREWVHDSYFTSINENLSSEIPDEFRISRGGGYMSRDKDCESTSRETNSLFHRFRNLGFRLALSEVQEDVPENQNKVTSPPFIA